MESKANLFIKIFEWTSKQLQQPIGAGLLAFLLGAGLIGLYSYQRNSEFREDKVTLLKSLEREKEENDFLQKQIIKADEDCAQRFVFMAQTIDEIQRGVSKNKEMSDKLTEETKKSNEEIKKIKSKL